MGRNKRGDNLTKTNNAYLIQHTKKRRRFSLSGGFLYIAPLTNTQEYAIFTADNFVKGVTQMIQVTQARADYSNILPQKNQKIKIFLWRNRSAIGRSLIFVGITLLFIAVGDTSMNTSIFWGIGFGVLGLVTSFIGLHILEPNRR